MKGSEKEKLKEIPSTIDHNEILKLVQSSSDRSRDYFKILKTITNEDDKEISAWLNINEKTFRTHKTTNKITRSSLVEHAIMLISLFKHGKDVFGTSEQFKKWLETDNFHFNKKSPVDFMSTISGIKYIDDRLTGLEYGDNA